MIEIKFRSWDKDDKAMRSWKDVQIQKEYGEDFYLVGYKENKALTRFDHEQILMQYTGLKDKNGKEIYEGDIVDCFAGEHYHGIWEYQKRYVVEFGWTECMWEMLNCDLIEVIGNIYENPELMDARGQ